MKCGAGWDKLLSMKFVALLLIALLVAAPDSRGAAGPGVVLEKGVAAADTTQRFLSDRVEELARRLDSFLGGRKALEENTGSYFMARVGYDAVGGETPGRTLESRFQLGLPLTQEKLKIEVDTRHTAATEENTISRVDPATERNRSGRTNSLFTGLVAELFSDDRFRATAGGGVNLALKPDPYAKAVLAYTVPFGAEWRLKVEEGGFWTGKEGYSSRSQATLMRHVFEASALSSSTVALWTENEPGWSLGETVSLLQTVDADTALAYRAGMLGLTSPFLHDTRYFTDVTCRRTLHSNWLFLEAQGGLAWPRERNFVVTPEFFAWFEVLFGK